MEIGVPQPKLLIQSGKNEDLGPGTSPPVPRAPQRRESSLSQKGHPMQRCDLVGEQPLPADRGPESVFGDQKRKGNGTYLGS